MEHFLDHFDHAARLVGPEQLGYGSDSDLDGWDNMPKEYLDAAKKPYKTTYGFRDKIDIDHIDHPKRIYDIVEGLIRRGYSDIDIKGILGENFKRVLLEIWSN